MLARRLAPLRRLARYTRLNRRWLVRSLCLIAVMVLWASAFTILKMQIPHWMPYYADPMLANLDRALLGQDGWRLTHAVLGEQATSFLDRAYALWFAFFVCFLGWTIGTRKAAFQAQSLLSLVVIWLVLGVGGATLFSSVGPCFYERFYGAKDYAPLMELLRSNSSPLTALQAMNYLESMFGKTAYAGGISAFPSMHVATAVWFVLVSFEGSRRAFLPVLSIAFAALILIASVHLGWHYLADGLFSLLAVPAIWFGIKYLLSAQFSPALYPKKDMIHA